MYLEPLFGQVFSTAFDVNVNLGLFGLFRVKLGLS